MKGNQIIVSSNPKGVFMEGIVSGTPKPGTMMQLQAGTAPVGGRHTYEVYNPGASGDPRAICVLLPDDNQGQLTTTAYVSGARCFLYFPLAGEELNMIVHDVTGTADIHTIADRLIGLKGAGTLIAQGTSANRADFVAMETVAALTADKLMWVRRE